MVSIKDVAREAGVSLGTVSNVINNRGNVSPELRKRILEVIDRLGYIPKVYARNLKTQKSNSIGIILPTVTDNYYARVFTGLQNCLINRGFNINLTVTNDISAIEEKALFNMLSQRVAGVVLVTSNPENASWNIEKLKDRNIPLVIMDRKIDVEYGNFISFDYKKVGKDLCRELLNRGFRRPVIITGPTSFSCEKDFIDGFNSEYNEAGTRFETLYIFQTSIHKFCSFKLLSSFLTELEIDNYPDVVVTTSRILENGVLEAIDIMGIDRRKKIKVISLKEQNWLEMVKPNVIKMIFRPAYELGKKAAKILIENIDSIKVYTPRRLILPVEPAIPTEENERLQKKRYEDRYFNNVKKELKLYMLKDISTRAIKTLINDYDKGEWEFDIKQFDIDDLFEAIIASNKNESEQADIFMIDIPWIPYLANNNYILDISDYVKKENEEFLDGYVRGVFDLYSLYKNSYYCLPFNFSIQLLFYRKDIFENKHLQNQFKKLYGIELRVPTTWDEYNAIAEFFTKKYNPESPVDFGNTIGGATSNIVEFLPRLWAYGGKVFDEEGNIVIDSYEGMVALKNYIKSFDYAIPGSIDHWWWHQIDTFAKGRAAMMIMYVNHTGNLVDREYSEVVGKFSVAEIPGKIPALGGWSLGINKLSPKREESYRFIRWASSSRIAVPFTVLGGCTPRSMINRAEELLDLYPYLVLAEKSFHKSRKRTYALDNLSEYNLNERHYDTIVSNYLSMAVKKLISPEEALKSIQRDLKNVVGFEDRYSA